MRGTEHTPGAKARFLSCAVSAGTKVPAYLRSKGKGENKDKYGDSDCVRMTVWWGAFGRDDRFGGWRERVGRRETGRKEW